MHGAGECFGFQGNQKVNVLYVTLCYGIGSLYSCFLAHSFAVSFGRATRCDRYWSLIIILLWAVVEITIIVGHIRKHFVP